MATDPIIFVSPAASVLICELAADCSASARAVPMAPRRTESIAEETCPADVACSFIARRTFGREPRAGLTRLDDLAR
jgi:hypothetical protein